SPQAHDALSGLKGTPYISPVSFATLSEAEQAMRLNRIDAIVRIPPDFSRRLTQGNARVQLLLNGVSTTTASAIEGYVTGAMTIPLAKQADRAAFRENGDTGSVSVVQRMWFNETADSTWYLVPGLIVLVLTLIGAFLTSLLIIRERERGTLEALFVTPVQPLELVVAKLTPYLLLGFLDLVICLILSHFLFAVPMRGSLWVILMASILYLIVSLSLGLFISGKAESQFLASQMALIISFMPAMMLSGFVFDLRNLPVGIQVISQFLPATHFMPLIKTLFLGGNDWSLVLRECGILLFYALVLINASRITLRKRIG
ncbi:MAG: ABC transporter permease, partial [Desulfatitalea sp.]|nr:ABC transporter permease [Desulfatitalea sp.]